MKKTALILFILQVVMVKAQKGKLALPTGGASCMKFEEKLYLNSLLNRQGSSRSYMDSLKGCMSESPGLYLALGKYYYNRSEYGLAEEEFLKLIHISSLSKGQAAEAYHYLGLSCYYLNQNERSFDYSAKALELGYNASWSYNNMGLTFYARNQPEEANRHYKKALKADPHNDVSASNLSNNYRRMHNETEALKYSTLADSIVNSSKAAYKSGMIRSLIELQREEEAFAMATEAHKKFPNDKEIIEDYSKVLFKQHRYSEIPALARQLLRQGPSDAREWHSVAYIYDNAGELDSAFYFYNVCLKHDPKMATALGNIGLIYKKLGLFEKAHAKLDEALAIDSGSHYYYGQKQVTYLWQRDFENSYLWAMKCMQLFPERKGSEFNIGYSLQQLKKYKEAIPYYRTMLLQEPGDNRLFNNIGRCFAELKQPDSAMAYFEKALASNPENCYIYHNRAALYYDLGKYDLACSDLRTAIEKEYTWTIDSKLIEMKKKHCPEVNTNIKVLINAYRGNSQELARYPFIELSDSLLNTSIAAMVVEHKEPVKENEENRQTSSAAGAFKVYPNPSSGLFYVEHSTSLPEELTLRVFDGEGKLVFTDIMTGTGKKELNLKHVPAGIYVLMILNNTSVLTARKLVIEHPSGG